jgi:signal transduction histidine kinase
MQVYWKRFLARFWEIAGGVPIRTKILGIVLGGTVLLSTSVIYQLWQAVTRTMQQELEARGVSIARDLAARAIDPILINDLYSLHQLIGDTRLNNPDVVYAFVVDAEGKVLAHSFQEGFPPGLLESNSVQPDQHHHTVLLQTNEGLVWDVAVPIFAGKAGIARTGISTQRAERVFLSITSQVILTTLVVLGISLPVAAFLTFILTRPILDLVEATRAVTHGDFTRRVRRWADDEIGDLADAFNTMTAELGRMDELRREREQLRRLLLEKVIATQEDERRRIARELHDSTSQNLTSLMVGLRMLETLCDDGRIRAQAHELRAVAAQTLNEVHEISMRLRPRLLDDLGLAAALERLVQEWQARHKIPVDLLIHIGDGRLPDEVETAIYRIIQESLTNVARHAQAHSVSVLVERRRHEVVAVIEDDGQGFDITLIKRDRHLGLAGIQERAELLGGRLTVESAPGQGTSIFVSIPIAESAL